MKRQELLVAALKNGTVIDHIPSEKLFTVVNLLHLQKLKNAVTIGFNLKSDKMGIKSIIKVANKYFTDEELNKLSVIAPDVTLAIIKDYEVLEKKTVVMPDILTGIITCGNPKCITNNEPMPSIFHVINKDKGLIRCHYCEKVQRIEEVKLANKL